MNGMLVRGHSVYFAKNASIIGDLDEPSLAPELPSSYAFARPASHSSFVSLLT